MRTYFKIFILCVSSTFLFLKGVMAEEYTMTNALKYDITKSVQTADGSFMGLVAEGVWTDSRGNKGSMVCVGYRGKELFAHCNSTDQDGDVQYSTARRIGSEGENTIHGGTGKYANASGGCTYQVEAFDKDILVGLISVQCTVNK
tara:strand:- start:563 stop:997 length:435 start_codon:yes stop_codon:yes gene_type:complete